jgi:hypothetical protein
VVKVYGLLGVGVDILDYLLEYFLFFGLWKNLFKENKLINADKNKNNI